MKISNSKQELARIISENGGWRDGEFAAQNGEHGRISFSTNKPVRHDQKSWMAKGGFQFKIEVCKPLPNWHQTILSREEYFHLYPALGELCGKVTEENRHEQVWTNPPSIEQLAADYRNAKDYADRKQKEADAAKADAEVKLAGLVAAGAALGLELSVAGAEPALVITDWRDWMIGDLVELINRQGGSAKVGEVGEISKAIGNGDFYVDFPSQSGYSVEHSDIKFIRRP